MVRWQCSASWGRSRRSSRTARRACRRRSPAPCSRCCCCTEPGRPGRHADRRALGRGAARDGAEGAPGARLAAAQGDRRGAACSTRPPRVRLQVGEGDELDLDALRAPRRTRARELPRGRRRRRRSSREALALWRGAAARRLPLEPFARARRSRGSRSSGSRRSRTGSTPTSRSAATTARRRARGAGRARTRSASGCTAS